MPGNSELVAPGSWGITIPPAGVHAGKEGGPASRAALFGVIGHKPRAFLGDAVDVGVSPTIRPWW